MTDSIPGLMVWKFICSYCENRTYTIYSESQPEFEEELSDVSLIKYLKIRVLTCDNCSRLYALGTYLYKQGNNWVRLQGTMATNHEDLAFQIPGRVIKLPATTPKTIKQALEEAQFAIDHRKPLSAGAMIRTAIDRLISAEKIKANNIVTGIESLPIDKELKDDLKGLNIVGKTSLHAEDYKIEELTNALNILKEVIDDIYGRRERRTALKKAIDNKASDLGKKSNPA